MIVPLLLSSCFRSIPIGFGLVIATILSSNVAAIVVSDEQRDSFIMVPGIAKLNL